MVDQLVGKRLGAYQVQALLGEGGMARVYKAYHERLQREVALKVIHPESSQQADFQRRFEREAQLIARLQHRNIVAVYDAGESDTLSYLVMQYVAGGTLHNLLAGQRALEPRRAALYALQMTRALHHAHMHGIVHRDIKPQNMLLSADNSLELLLSDFGLAKLFEESPEIIAPSSAPLDAGSTLSRVGDIVGTPKYMAPEQCAGKAVDARTDIYALGVVLFEMLTGRPPFQGPSTYSLLYQQTQQAAPPVRSINPSVPEPLAAIAERALTKPPEQRYQSAKEMGQALEAFLTPPQAVTPGAEKQEALPTKGKRRRKTSLRLSAVLTALICLVAIFQLLRSGLLPWSLPGQPANNVAAAPQVNSCIDDSAAVAQPFLENFQDNHRGWQQDSFDSVTPTINGGTYNLSIGNSNKENFLCPKAASVGILPANFSLSAKIAQKQGNATVYYGLAFHLSYQQAADKVAGYALVVSGQGICAFIKYDPQEAGGYKVLKSIAHVSAVHEAPESNNVQVTARGGQFTFRINDQPILFDGSTGEVSDQTYTRGLPGLVVAGPNTVFAVTSVQLSEP